MSATGADTPDSSTDDSGSAGEARGLANNTGWALGSQALVIGTRTAVFLVLAALLDPVGYGQFAAVISLMEILSPIAQLGMAHLAVRAVARGLPLSPMWHRLSSTALIGGLVATAVVVPLRPVLFDDVPIAAIVLLGISQICFFGLLNGAMMIAEADRRADVGTRFVLVNAIARVLALLPFVLLGRHTVMAWSIVLFVATLVTAVATFAIVHRQLGAPFGLARPDAGEVRSGMAFVVATGSDSLQADVDKVILKAQNFDVDTGIYAAGYRLAQMTIVPISALVRASYGDFFRRGASQVRDALPYAKKLCLIAAGYATVVAIGLLIFAPWLKFLLGDEFADSVRVVRYLAFIPLLKALQYFPANTLSGSDHQPVRATLLTMTALGNIVLNLLLIPGRGWEGAAIATNITEGVYAVGLWIAVWWLARSEVGNAT